MADDYKTTAETEKKAKSSAKSAEGVSELRQKMEERNEQARRTAEERAAKLEYEDAYRNKIADEKAKRDAEKKRRKEEEERAKSAEIASEREREIAEFLRKEREEAEARAAQSEELLRALEKSSENDTPTIPNPVIASESEVQQPSAEVEEAAVADTKIHISADSGKSGEISIGGQIAPNQSAQAYYQPPVGGVQIPAAQPIYPYGAAPMQNPAWQNGYPQQNVNFAAAPSYAPDSQLVQNQQIPNAANNQEPLVGEVKYPDNPSIKLTESYGENANINTDDTAKKGLELDRERAKGDFEEAHDLYRKEELAYIEEQKRRYEADANALRAKREELAARRADLSAGGIEIDIPQEQKSDVMAPQYHTPEDEKKISDYAEYLAERERKRNAKLAKKGEKPVGNTQIYPSEPEKIQRYNVGVDDGEYPSDAIDYSANGEAEYREPEYDDVSLTVGKGESKGDSKSDEPSAAALRSELYKKLAKLHKAEDELVAKREKISKKQKKSTDKYEKAKALTEKIALSKEIIRISEDEVFACVYARDEKETKKHKKLLTDRIKEYNEEISALEKETGELLAKIDKKQADSVALLNRRIPIPDIRYVGTRVEYSDNKNTDVGDYSDADTTDGVYIDVDHPISSDSYGKADKRAERDEQIRLLREEREREERRRREAQLGLAESEGDSEADKKSAKKQKTSLLAKIKQAKGRDELLISARTRYKISQLESERDMLETTFTVSTRAPKKEIGEVNARIKKARAVEKEALKLEKIDNELYYKLLTMTPQDIKSKRFDPESFASVKSKIEILLGEREELNERLLLLYDANGKKGAKNAADAVNSVKKRHAGSMYKRQKKLAKKVNALHMPRELKEKIFELMNRKTELVSTAETLKYRLKKTKPKGSAKKQLKYELKRTKASIKRTDADIEFMIKKADKHHNDYKAGREWGRWIIGIIIVLAVGFAVWYFAGDIIAGWVKSLLSKGGVK